MRSRIPLACFASLALVLAAPPASAKNCSGIFSTCIDEDTLWPHAGPARFVAVGSTETVAPGQIAFGLASTYLHAPIVIETNIGPTSQTKQYVVKDQVDGTFLWSYGVTDRLELDLAVPVTFGQGGGGLSAITGGGALKDTAVRDLRFGFAYALLPHARVAPDASPRSFGLLYRLEVSAPTGDSDQFAGERSGVFIPSFAADWRSGRLLVGAELGARIRPTTELLGNRVGTQLVTALGVGYDILKRRELLVASLEAWSLPTFSEQHSVTEPAPGTYISAPDGKTIAPTEWQLAVRSAPTRSGDLSIQLGGGSSIPITAKAITEPDFRFTLSVRWAPTGRAVVASSPQ
ncbi:MAG TPA: hypothetical protein VIF09_18310 [Polyangiaceae bacterium]|jgi:hypothetical protein